MAQHAVGLGAHMRPTHNLYGEECDKVRDGAIRARFNEYCGGIPFLNFAAPDIKQVLQKIYNGDMSFLKDVEASLIEAPKVKEKPKKTEKTELKGRKKIAPKTKGKSFDNANSKLDYEDYEDYDENVTIMLKNNGVSSDSWLFFFNFNLF